MSQCRRHGRQLDCGVVEDVGVDFSVVDGVIIECGFDDGGVIGGFVIRDDGVVIAGFIVRDNGGNVEG